VIFIREPLRCRAVPLILLLAAVALLGSSAARAQESAPQPVHWTDTFKTASATLRPGQKVTLNLTAAIDSGWHVYALTQPPDSPVIATQITVPDGQALALSGDIEASQAESKMDPTIGKRTAFYEDSASFALPLRVNEKARPGKRNFEVDVRFQACNDRLCLPPRTQKVETPIEIASRHYSLGKQTVAHRQPLELAYLLQQTSQQTQRRPRAQRGWRTQRKRALREGPRSLACRLGSI
jgi:DsbC/DsbD-like thiol-disulfide interchange protein